MFFRVCEGTTEVAGIGLGLRFPRGAPCRAATTTQAFLVDRSRGWQSSTPACGYPAVRGFLGSRGARNAAKRFTAHLRREVSRHATVACLLNSRTLSVSLRNTLSVHSHGGFTSNQIETSGKTATA